MVRQESLTVGKGISIITVLFLMAIVAYLIANAVYWNREYKNDLTNTEIEDISRAMYIVSIIGVVIGGILFLIWVFATPILLRTTQTCTNWPRCRWQRHSGSAVPGTETPQHPARGARRSFRGVSGKAFCPSPAP